MTRSFCDLTVIYGVSMLTYTISVSTHSILLRYSLVLSKYLHEQPQHMPRYTPRYNQYQAEAT